MLYLSAHAQPQHTYNTPFVCVNYLKGSLFDLVEVKCTLLSVQSESSSYWLRISKNHKDIDIFKLCYIDSSNAIEERYFDEGFLKFNVNKGTFIEKFNSGQHDLFVAQDYHLPKKLLKTITDKLHVGSNLNTQIS